METQLKSEELKWEIGDYAWINQCCLAPEVLQITGKLRQNKENSGIKMANSIWKTAIEEGVCYDISPKVFKVKLIELIDTYERIVC